MCEEKHFFDFQIYILIECSGNFVFLGPILCTTPPLRIGFFFIEKKYFKKVFFYDSLLHIQQKQDSSFRCLGWFIRNLYKRTWMFTSPTKIISRWRLKWYFSSLILGQQTFLLVKYVYCLQCRIVFCVMCICVFASLSHLVRGCQHISVMSI